MLPGGVDLGLLAAVAHEGIFCNAEHCLIHPMIVTMVLKGNRASAVLEADTRIPPSGRCVAWQRTFPEGHHHHTLFTPTRRRGLEPTRSPPRRRRGMEPTMPSSEHGTRGMEPTMASACVCSQRHGADHVLNLGRTAVGPSTRANSVV